MVLYRPTRGDLGCCCRFKFVDLYSMFYRFPRSTNFNLCPSRMWCHAIWRGSTCIRNITLSQPTTLLIKQGHCRFWRYVIEFVALSVYHFSSRADRILIFHISIHNSTAGWEATFTACNRSPSVLTIDGRKSFCTGICYILASLPDSQRATSLMALAMPSLGCLDAMIRNAESSKDNKEMLSAILDRAAAEIIMLTAIARAYTDADAASINTVRERTSDTHPALAGPAVMVLQRAWASISTAASSYGYHNVSAQCLSLRTKMERLDGQYRFLTPLSSHPIVSLFRKLFVISW